MKRKTLPGILCMLLLAGCISTPPPAPTSGSEAPPAAPSDTPAAEATETQPGYPVGTPTEDPGEPYPAPPEPTVDESGYPAPTDASGYPVGTDQAGYPAPGSEQSDCTFETAAPQRHELTALDGTALIGTFYPAADCSAPLVILYHQFGSNRESWSDLARWMQNRTEETAYSGKPLASPLAQYSWFPSLPDDLSLAVFALDFRNHGESEDTGTGLNGAGFLMDAQAALDFAKTLPNVDPDRVITMGASIGSDASVDVCLTLDGAQPAEDQVNEGCIGAMPLSPGSYLGPIYTEVVTRLAQPPFAMHIHCLATELDGPSPELCAADLPGDYEFSIYPGRSEHGIAMIREDMEPSIGLIIHDFLLTALSIDD